MLLWRSLSLIFIHFVVTSMNFFHSNLPLDSVKHSSKYKPLSQTQRSFQPLERTLIFTATTVGRYEKILLIVILKVGLLPLLLLLHRPSDSFGSHGDRREKGILFGSSVSFRFADLTTKAFYKLYLISYFIYLY